MQQEMVKCFFVGFVASAPLVAVCGIFLAFKRALGVIASDD